MVHAENKIQSNVSTNADFVQGEKVCDRTLEIHCLERSSITREGQKYAGFLFPWRLSGFSHVLL